MPVTDFQMIEEKLCVCAHVYVHVSVCACVYKESMKDKAHMNN